MPALPLPFANMFHSPSLIGLALVFSTTALVAQKTLLPPNRLPVAPAITAGQAGNPADKEVKSGNTQQTKSPQAKPLDKDALLMAKLAKTTFDRRPSTMLKKWADTGQGAKPGKNEAGHPEPGKDKAQVAKNPTDVALEKLTMDVARGNWQGVETFFHTQFKKTENANKAYGLMLDALARPPRIRVQPGSSPVTTSPKFAEKQFLSPGDVVSLADACPGELDSRTVLPKLGRLLKASITAGHFPNVIVEILNSGSDRLGGTADNDKRHNAARLLMAAGLPVEAGLFLPGENQPSSQALDLLAGYHVAMHAKTKEKKHLSAAWQATQSALMHPEVNEDGKGTALARAVELVPKIEENLGKEWLGKSFTGDAIRGREVLATIGSMTSRGLAERVSTERLRRLTLQRTAVLALLEAGDIDLNPWSKVLTLLAMNWLGEATLSYRYDTSKTLGPKMRWDRFGNMYYENPTASKTSSSSMPAPIPSGELLKVSPGEEWISLLEADLRPRFHSLFAQLYLKVNEPEKAFPYIEQISSSHPDSGKTLAEEFLRVWADNRDPNSGRNRSYKYGYMYGYNQRANSIPLTRSKQERNLAELAEWAEKLQSLPTGKLDQTKLTEAFTKIHSRAEVYKPAAIRKIFGDFKNMDAKTVSAIASTMRTNLATVWRNPKTQQDMKTRRKDAEIMAEVSRGYESAGGILTDSLQSHPQSWRLWLVRACLAFDRNNFAQENGSNSEFITRRREAFSMFSRAAELYGNDLPESEVDESTQVYEHWMYAALGASDLGALSEKQQPSPAQVSLIKAALEKLPDGAAQRHMARFANALAARISAVKPELKQRYLKHGLTIVGAHEKAAEARKIFDYYKDLVTEIQLVATLDGSPTVGHTEPFGVFIDIRHTREIERESGGFSKYLTNQNNASYAYNYGRPTQNYRDKFEETARSALAEHFEVMSVSFHDNKITSRGAGREGWRNTPYAYLLLKARSPEVDKIPPVQIDLDFLDTSGFVILPIATPPVPINAKPALSDTHGATKLEIVQILDERKAQEGKIEVEIKATAHGLVPVLEQLLDFPSQGFDLTETSGGELSIGQLDAEGEQVTAISERNWMLTFTATDSSPKPGQFTFADPLIEESNVAYQRYEDADLVVAEKTTALKAGVAKKQGGLSWALLAAILILGTMAAVRLLRKNQPDPAAPGQAGNYSIPSELTPFTVIGLLHRIRDEDGLGADLHPQLRQAIEKLERYYFEHSEGDPPDLKALAEKWVALAA
ncbi:MAG: hypothetical protein MK183_12455 [Verrucomicrobiales bacterium]|nr:hypothetical protein [Verrucomicrobiales bacterium]